MASIHTANGLMLDIDQQAGQRFRTLTNPKTNEIVSQYPISNGTLRDKAISRKARPKHMTTPKQDPGPRPRYY
jgi:hypothetical protein